VSRNSAKTQRSFGAGVFGRRPDGTCGTALEPCVAIVSVVVGTVSFPSSMIVEGENVQLAFVGSPAQASVADPEYPPEGENVMTLEPLLPWTIATVGGLAVSKKAAVLLALM
jgi:hypothetical protein